MGPLAAFGLACVLIGNVFVFGKIFQIKFEKIHQLTWRHSCLNNPPTDAFYVSVIYLTCPVNYTAKGVISVNP